MTLTLISPRGAEKAILFVKKTFEERFSEALNLERVSAPLILDAQSGINDDLNGEVPVRFEAKFLDKPLVIPHSLAKWKRIRLMDFNYNIGEGIYTDMNSIRKEEYTSPISSIYVDQWDWEKVIQDSDQCIEYLDSTVKKIYLVLREVQDIIHNKYDIQAPRLPENIYFVDSQELEDMYPHLTPKQRENEICREKGAVFIRRIGNMLKSGTVHDKRAPDYDNWNLNGDLLCFYDPMDMALELSSMGIRVSPQKCIEQLAASSSLERQHLPFHKLLIGGKLPSSIGGGIGQSRLCLFLLRKRHIGEVQVSVWRKSDVEEYRKRGIRILS